MSEERKEIVEKEEMTEEKGLSRRKFLVGAMAAGGAAAAGLTRVTPAFAASGVTLKVNGKNVTTDVAPFIQNGRTMVPARFVAENLSADVGWDGVTRTATITSKEMGFPYKKLDPEKARKAGYEGYITQGKGCMYGSAYGLITLLREEVGYPWTNMPMDAFKYGLGGALAGSLCGAQNGALFVMGMILGNDINKADNNSMKKLNDWYTSAEIPLNDKHTGWSAIATSEPMVSATVDCRDSKNVWCEKFGYKSGSAEQKQRCGKLCGDVAAKTAEILNAYFGY